MVFEDEGAAVPTDYQMSQTVSRASSGNRSDAHPSSSVQSRPRTGVSSGSLPNKFGAIPRPASPISGSGVGGAATVFAGTLFPSFDPEANYLAKQAELRDLGFDMEDATSDGAPNHPNLTSSGRQQSSTIPLAEKDDGSAELKVLERQIKRRDELYVAAQRRADEAKEYAAMITHLRAEAKRSEDVRKDVQSSLVAQVEALQYVVQRRNDADNQAAKVRFVDVENEVLTVSKEMDDETEEQLKRIGRLGEEPMRFVEQLSAQSIDFVRDHQNIDVLEVELRETQSLLLQQVGIRVSMLSDRVRSDLMKALSSELRSKYTITPSVGGKASASLLTDALRSILSAYCRSDVERIVAELRTDIDTRLQEVTEQTWKNVSSDVEPTVEKTLRRVEAVASTVLEGAVQRRAEELETESILLAQHTQDAATSNEKRRTQEEHALRDVVLDMGKLLEAQRLAMNDLRTQLLLQAKAHSIASSPSAAKSQRNKSKSPAQAHHRNRAGSTSNVVARPRHMSPATSRRLLFEPLTENQIKSLYGALPSHATVVEEVSVERLSRITTRASMTKKATPHEQDQLILVSRQPASLIGRGSTQKVPTKLTAPTAGSRQQQQKDEGGPAATSSSKQHAYNNGELATLQELRRLRIKIDR